MRCSDGDVVYEGDPHVGVGLEAEGEDGGADEEHGDDPNTLPNTHRSNCQKAIVLIQDKF